MHWLKSLDSGLFHWINTGLVNPVFDVVMPLASNTPHFGLGVMLICAFAICKGGARGRLCVLMCVLAVGLGDTFICNTIKQAVARPRPFLALADVHMPPGIGMSGSGSMPSSHAANWFAVTMVIFIYYRSRSLWFTLPLALLVSFSRIYNGVHYPSDVLAGAILGAGYAACGVWTLNALWQSSARRWFPLQYERFPSLINPPAPAPNATPRPALTNQQWLRLAYILLAAFLAINWWYIASGKIDLSEDEAYQWIWSKHLALSYFSKPPLIAYSHFISTHIWGDTPFGIRFFSPLLATIGGLVLLHLFAREVNARAAFWLVIIILAVPILGVGAILMTIDSPSVLFWTLAMVAGWKACRENSTPGNWLWVGLWTGLGFLSKYTAIFQLLSWIMFFALWPPARQQLRRPGPYLALFIGLLCAIPVLIWNSENHWITVHHLEDRGGLGEKWAFTAANLWRNFTHFTLDFVGQEFGLMNPIFFAAIVWASFAFWRRRGQRYELKLFLFSMAAPIFLCYLAWTLRARVLPNWIAPAVLPFLCLAVVHWEERWRDGVKAVKGWLTAGLAIGLTAVIVLHDTNLIGKVTGWNLTPKRNPVRRVVAWKETADVVKKALDNLRAEGKPVFIIGDHYGIVSAVTFYLPEAKAGVPDHPLAYFNKTPTPENQFYFWPGYDDRKGQNAIFIREMSLGTRTAPEPPKELLAQFDSVRDLGIKDVVYRGGIWRQLQVCECRGLH